MTVIATDNFNRANNTTLGTNWTNAGDTNVFRINSNQADPTQDGGDKDMYWNANTFPNDHYSKASLISTGGVSGGGNGPGIGVRISGTSSASINYYRVIVNAAATNNVEVDKDVAGSFTAIASGITQAWTSGDTWELDAQSTTLTVKHLTTTVTTQTDSSLASGSAGINYSSTESTARVDNWEGGDFSTSGFTAEARRTLHQFGNRPGTRTAIAV